MSLTCGFIGLGLIGGSIARALKTADPQTRIVACDADRGSVTRAYSDGVVDVLVSGIDQRFGDCDFVFLCAPVRANMGNAARVAPFLKEGAILTDVGSVKGEMHAEIEKLGLSSRFIGGHPMAGSERNGYANSKAKLLENAYYIITPTPETGKDDLERYRRLVSSIGAIPLIMTPERHDEVTAAVSHVPHVVSASLVNLVRESDSPDGEMRMVAAGGFKDITRISSSSPVMWQNICLANADDISSLLGRYIEMLQRAKGAVDARDGDRLMEFFDSARRYRDSFIDASSGPIKTANAVHVEIPDEPGALAVAVTILASKGISVKNVGIVHNREFETGSLRIELHDEGAVEEAVKALVGHGYDAAKG